jgi:hypothetical protein
MQFKIFGRIISVYFKKKGKDWKFSARCTFEEPIVAGIRSTLDNRDIYQGQLHFGMFDIDDNLPLEELIKKIKDVQEKFKEFVGDSYIYETSPKKYSFHFYNSASYWDWLKIAHYLSDVLDPQYVHWRLFRPSMVMRISPKSNGFIPRLVCIVKSPYPKIENTFIKNSLLEILNRESFMEMRKNG